MAIVRQRPAPGLIHHSIAAFSMPPSLIGWLSRDQQ